MRIQKIQLISIVCLSVLFTSPLFAYYADFQKELDYEKLLEDKLKNELTEILGPKKFIVIVDIEKRNTEVKEDLPGEKEGMSDLGVPLPGMLSKETQETPIIALPDDSTPAETEFNPNNYKKSISLYIESEISPEVLDIIKRRATQIAQLNVSQGDNVIAKITPLAEALTVAQSGELPQTLTPGAPTSVSQPLLSKDLLIIIGAGVVLLIFILLLTLLLLKGRSSKAQARNDLYGAQERQPVQIQQRIEPQIIREIQPVHVAAAAPQPSTAEQTQILSKDLLKQDVINQCFSRPDLLATIISNWVIEENGLRQAASLIKIFGIDTAMNLFADVASQERAKILAFYNTVDNWDIQEEINALSKLKANLVAKKYEQNILSEGTEASHFSFIKKLSDYQLFYLIKDEDSRVIALLLTYLPADRAAKLVGQLSPKQKSEIAVEIGNINYINSDILNAVTKRLAEKSLMIPKFDLYPGSGINSLVSILDHLDSKDESFVLNTIKEFDPNLAKKIKKAYFVFDDLLGLSKEALKIIIKDVSKNALATSLVGVDENFIAKVLSILPERKAEMLKFDMDKQKNAPQAEIIKAQKEIVIKIREMIRNGELDIEKATKPADVAVTPKQPNGGTIHTTPPTTGASATTTSQQGVKPAQPGIQKPPQTPPGVKINPQAAQNPKPDINK